MKYQVASATDVGLVRKNNEDYFLVDEGLDLFIVADGMGGYEKGELASRITCDSIRDYLKPINNGSSILKEDIVQAVKTANEQIREKIKSTPNIDRMGSTVVSLLMKKDRLLIANVGDSRAYRFRENRLEQITVDHSLVQETKAAGIKKELAPQFRNIVTRALGMKECVEADIFAEKAKKGDIFLLCSDGLHGFVVDQKISEILHTEKNNLQKCLEKLIDASKNGGGRDNITGILIEITETPKEAGPLETDSFQVPNYELEKKIKRRTFIRDNFWGIILIVSVILLVTLFVIMLY